MKILSVCGSPRKGNSETIINRMHELLEKRGAENEIILLRGKNIGRCDGLVEYCNKNLKCDKKDDMTEILEKIKTADGYIFVLPNYFKMPPGIFKDFIDRCSVLYTAQTDMSKKKAVVIVVGADAVEEINVCLQNVCDNFCKTMGINVVAKKSFHSNSELKGNYEDIFQNKLNKDIEKELEGMADKLLKSLKK